MGETKPQQDKYTVHNTEQKGKRKRKEKKKQQDETKAETTHAHENKHPPTNDSAHDSTAPHSRAAGRRVRRKK
jgi:hypothetical protein